VDADELKLVLENHKKWLAGEAGGVYANLHGADLRGADLRGADLSGADLSGANLHGADLCRANLEFSCWPLWCGSKNVKIDAQFAAQYLAHFYVLDCDDPRVKALQQAVFEFAQTCHRAVELGLKKE